MSVVKIEYHNFLSHDWNIVSVTNNKHQTWNLIRVGISEDEVKDYVWRQGKTNGIKDLIETGYLKPIYGGDLNL